MLPNCENAIVDQAKLVDYCLNPSHPRGRHKARVFWAVLGLTSADADELREALLNAAMNLTETPGATDEFGRRYFVDFTMVRNGRSATIRSTWIVRYGEDFPRLTSCYVL